LSSGNVEEERVEEGEGEGEGKGSNSKMGREPAFPTDDADKRNFMLTKTTRRAILSAFCS
jgi:hypothetical protein